MDIYENEAYNIRQTLERQNAIQQEMLGVMNKQDNKFKRILDYAVLIVSVLSILEVADILINWIKGGI